MSVDGQSKAQFYAAMKVRFNKCLSPTMHCPNDAIRAHSVQKATALSLIEEVGHVSELKPKIVADEPVCEFTKIGRNSASTFTGLCGEHDTEIFLPIDTKPLDLEDAEQLFLIAYRSVTRELHVVMESALRLQSAYMMQIKLGIVDKNEPCAAGIEATRAWYKSWLVWRYRYQHYDLALANGRFKDILHSTFTISGRMPVLASSSFFPVDDTLADKGATRIALNVIPIASDETAVVFSYPKVQSGTARKRIAPVMLKSGEAQLLAFSTMVLDATENFFMRLSHVASWSDEKRNRIEKAFASTVSEGTFLQPSPELMLF